MSGGMNTSQPDQVTITPTLTAGSGAFSVGGGSSGMIGLALGAAAVLFLLMRK